MLRLNRAARFLLPLAAGLLFVSGPAQAQFSTSFKFLEAVKKKDGATVDSMLDEPGTTIINTRDITSGQTALHIVTARRDLRWMSFLLGKGANPNVQDNRGRTPLMLASNLGFVDGVELLVSRKAHIDDSNATGETPLITAVHRNDPDMVRILLQAGANPDRADNSGRTARDYAKAGGKNRVLALIKENTKPRAELRASQPIYGPSL